MCIFDSRDLLFSNRVWRKTSLRNQYILQIQTHTMKKKSMKKVLTVVAGIVTTCLTVYGQYRATHPAPAVTKAKETVIKRVTKKTVSTRTVSEVTEEVCLVE